MNSIVIRPAEIGDFPSLLKAHQSSIREVASFDHNVEQTSAWSDHLTVDGYIDARRNGEEYFVAVEKGSILGFSSIKRNVVMAVYVSKNGVGRGLGSALYHTLEELAVSRNINELELTSSLTARDFYKKLGFVEIEEISHSFKSGVSVRAFRMKKSLKTFLNQ